MSARLDISFLTWALTVGLVVALLAVDLVVAARRPHHVGFGEATAWSAFYVAVAVAFGVWFTLHHGGGPGTEYFVGYLVEKSLSVDILFVFVIIMATFAAPDEHSTRCSPSAPCSHSSCARSRRGPRHRGQRRGQDLAPGPAGDRGPCGR